MGKPEFIYLTYTDTTPEKLWHALIDGDFSARYWFGAQLESERSSPSLSPPRAAGGARLRCRDG
jgi:hypothetical protein